MTARVARRSIEEGPSQNQSVQLAQDSLSEQEEEDEGDEDEEGDDDDEDDEEQAVQAAESDQSLSSFSEVDSEEESGDGDTAGHDAPRSPSRSVATSRAGMQMS